MIGLFGAAHGWRLKRPPICHTYPTMMKRGTVIPYLKKIQKMNHVTQSLSSGNISIFYRKSANCTISKNTDIVAFWYITSNSFNFNLFESLKFALIKMVTFLMISAKAFLKLRYLEIKDMSVITYVHGVTNKILSHDSNYFVDIIMCPKFGN